MQLQTRKMKWPFISLQGWWNLVQNSSFMRGFRDDLVTPAAEAKRQKTDEAEEEDVEVLFADLVENCWT